LETDFGVKGGVPEFEGFCSLLTPKYQSVGENNNLFFHKYFNLIILLRFGLYEIVFFRYILVRKMFTKNLQFLHKHYKADNSVSDISKIKPSYAKLDKSC